MRDGGAKLNSSKYYKVVPNLQTQRFEELFEALLSKRNLPLDASKQHLRAINRAPTSTTCQLTHGEPMRNQAVTVPIELK